MTNNEFPAIKGITVLVPVWMLDFTRKIMDDNQPNEACALVFGTTRKDSGELLIDIRAFREIKNLINSPSAFEIDPVEQFKIMEEERAGGNILIGILHTHPGSQFVSASDDFHIRNAGKISNLCWFIAGTREGQLEMGGYILVKDKIYSLELKFI